MFDHLFVADPQQNDIKKIRLVMALRHAGIHDARVLGAIEKTQRDLFVPPAPLWVLIHYRVLFQYPIK